MQRSIRKIKNAKGQTVYHARLRYIDSTGKPREILRAAAGKEDAKGKLAQLEAEIAEKGTLHLEAGKVTFRQLAEYCKEHHYAEAEYDDDGARISGVRSVKPAHSAIDKLVEYFGDSNIRKITCDDLRRYRVWRLSQKNKQGKKIQKATAHKDLQKAKAMFNIARRKKWLFSNPFDDDAKRELIQTATERKRERVLAPEEEKKFFKALDHPDRRHTIPVFITALDTGARRSSLVEHLKWKHIDFDAQTLIVTTYKDKNIKRWAVPMTQRVKAELLKLAFKVLNLKGSEPKALERLKKLRDSEELVLADCAVNLRKVYEAARIEAGIPDFQYRDLRHVTGTRLAVSGVEMAEVARILGHTNPKMTYRYFDLTKETRDKVRNVLDAYNDAVASAQAEGD